MNKFNSIAVFCFCCFLLAAGFKMVSDGAFIAGGFILLLGSGILSLVIIGFISKSAPVAASIDPVVRSNNKIIDDYFAGCILYCFNEIQKKDLRKGFLIGYGRGLLADDLTPVELDLDKKEGLHAGNSHEYEAGFNLGFIYAMDGVKPDFRIVMLQDSNRVKLMDNCDCNIKHPLRDNFISKTHNHSAYECLNCGGFYID